VQSFAEREVEEALAHAAGGGQALHLHRILPDPMRAPWCFRAAVRRGEYIAHLFDQDVGRLALTARRLGVKIVVVERLGTPAQHVDLCAGPLRRALALCEAAPQTEGGAS
jgi:hypothetical protein